MIEMISKIYAVLQHMKIFYEQVQSKYQKSCTTLFDEASPIHQIIEIRIYPFSSQAVLDYVYADGIDSD